MYNILSCKTGKRHPFLFLECARIPSIGSIRNGSVVGATPAALQGQPDGSASGLPYNSSLCKPDLGLLLCSVFVAAIRASRVRHFQAVNNQSEPKSISF